jgi:phenylpyruvate tautomerase PptA (4-oxalocrotonate tautomerase family)
MMPVIEQPTRGVAVPFFELTYPEGALEPDARAQLMDDLTTALLRAERAPETQFFRDITWSYVHELPAGSVLAAGRPVDGRPTFKLDVTTPQGALSDRRRAELVGDATRLISEAAGIPEDDTLQRVWVVMHEVTDGQWGAGGKVIRFQNLREIAQAELKAAAGG